MYVFRHILSIILIVTIGCNSSPKENKVLIDAGDINMVASTYQNTLFSLRTAEEVTTRGTSIETKNLADNFIKDKTKIKIELEKLAGKKGFELPLDITDTQIRKWKELVNKKSWEFDKAFVQMVVTLDSNLTKELQWMEEAARDADIQKTAGLLLEHNKNNKELLFEAQQNIQIKMAQKDSNVKAATLQN